MAKNFRKNIEGGIRAKGPMIEKLFNHALRISYAYSLDELREAMKRITRFVKKLRAERKRRKQ